MNKNSVFFFLFFFFIFLTKITQNVHIRLNAVQVGGRSARPNSRRCRQHVTPVRPSSSAPFLSCASTDLTDLISIGSTPKDLTINAISSLSLKVRTLHIIGYKRTCKRERTHTQLTMKFPILYRLNFIRTARGFRSGIARNEKSTSVVDGRRSRWTGQHQRRIRRARRCQLFGFHQRHGLRFPRQMGEHGRSQCTALLAIIRFRVAQTAVRWSRVQFVGAIGRASWETHHRHADIWTLLPIDRHGSIPRQRTGQRRRCGRRLYPWSRFSRLLRGLTERCFFFLLVVNLFREEKASSSILFLFLFSKIQDLRNVEIW